MPARADSDELIAWMRAELEQADGTVLGEGYQASVRRVTSPFGDYVVKCAHDRPLLGRLVRASVARESEVYRLLSGVSGIPRCYGLLDHACLVLEFVPGASLRQRQDELENRDAFFDALLETLAAMHSAGVAHGDLKRKDNILVGPGERPYIIDFGVACIRRPHGGFLNRLWFDWFRQMDYNAWIKLKYGGRPRNLSAADRPLHRELWIERFARRLRVLGRKLSPRRGR